MCKLRAMVISDISCVGRCSLTAALPVISAGGIECNIIPTAVFSTQTSGFEGYTHLDLTDRMLPIARHWEGLGLEFDLILTGFLGSSEQVGIVSEIIGMFKTDGTAVIVDPIMGDDGHLYPFFPKEYPESMRKLCHGADVIIPNATEASLLLGEGHPEIMSVEEAIAFSRDLSVLGAKGTVITGIRFGKRRIGSICSTGKGFRVHEAEYRKGSFHGSGDVYSGALAACLLNGKKLGKANRIASEFTEMAIGRTVEMGTDTRYGLEFEACLPFLMKELGL